jgi:hypothetical protein
MTGIDRTIEEACRLSVADGREGKIPDVDKIIDEAKSCFLPFESWERLAGESGAAYAAFRAYRDYGPERNIRRALEPALAGKDGGKVEKRYRMWRGWAAQFRWRERAADYDQYLDRLKQTELRKTIEEQGRVHRLVTGKMLQVVTKKLEMMNPAELTQGTVKDWVETAIRADRETEVCGSRAAGASRNSMPGQPEIQFTPDFEGL